jgi:penicillin-binding protein 2
MTATPLQLANAMCIIANKGYYYTPHFVDSIENETIADTVFVAKYRKKHTPLHIPDSSYEAVHAGMQDVTDYGTATRAKVAGINMCAKTGTAQNPHGKNHGLFVAFAPRENPTIAIAVVVENAGYGGVVAAPIASLMIEKYIYDTLSAASEKKAEEFAKLDYIPAAIKRWYYMKDSIRQAKEVLDDTAQIIDLNTERKTTFDPEAEPDRKDNDPIDSSKTGLNPMLKPNDPKIKRDNKRP